MSVVANRLRELRKKIGKSQEIIGGLLNISQSRISDYENGICAIPSDVLILFADYYKVTTDYILGLSDNSSYVQCTDTIADDEYSKLMALRSPSSKQLRFQSAAQESHHSLECRALKDCSRITIIKKYPSDHKIVNRRDMQFTTNWVLSSIINGSYRSYSVQGHLLRRALRSPANQSRPSSHRQR